MSRGILIFLARLMFVIFAVVTLVFLLQRLLPGNPADAVLGADAPWSDKASWLEAYGLNRPLHEQYLSYLHGLVRGEFGVRWIDGKPAAPLIAQRFLETLRLAVCALAVSISSALFFGMIGALKAGTRTDRLLAVVSLLFVSAPTFITGTALLWIFSVWLDLLPLTGSKGWDSLILPSFVLGITLAAVTGRMLRTSLIETLSQDFIRTAYSKGLSRLRVFGIHALRNALLPTTTLLGLQMGSLLGGAIITEQVFTWPGLGSLMMEAVSQRDYNLVSGCVVVLSVVQVCSAALVDFLHRLIDPRVVSS
jgi:peptide/nickel transport system permease protein